MKYHYSGRYFTYLIEKRWGSFLLRRSRGESGVFSTPLSPSFSHSEPLFLKLRWKRTLSWGTWKDSRLLSERWCTGWLSTLVLKGEAGGFEGWSGGQPLFPPSLLPLASLARVTTRRCPFVHLFGGLWQFFFLGVHLLLSLCSVDFSGAHPWAVTKP